MLSTAPVRPRNPPKPPASAGGGGGGDAAPKDHSGEKEQEEEIEEVTMKQTVADDPLIGDEGVLHDDNGPGAREARPLPSPPTATPAQKAKHDLTHQPPHPGCGICRSTRSPNLGHPASQEHLRMVPLLVGNYCSSEMHPKRYSRFA